MALVVKCLRRVVYIAEQVLELLEGKEDSNDGMLSDEESIFDNLFLDLVEDLR